MARSFGSHTGGRSGEKWLRSPICANTADHYEPWCLPEQPMNDEAIAKFGQDGLLLGGFRRR